SKKVALTIQLANRIAVQSRQDAIPIFLRAVALARSIDDKKAVGDALYAAGENYYYIGSQELTNTYMQQSMEIAEELADSGRIGQCLLRMGNAYYLLNEQAKAEECYLDALAIIQNLHDPILIGRTLNNLANTYGHWGQYVKALNLYDTARQYYETAGYIEGLGWLNFSIARLYKQISDTENALKHSQMALHYYQQLSESTGDSSGILICYGQLGDIYIQTGDLDKALEYHQVALRLRQKSGVKSAIADGYRGMGEIYYFQKNYTKALEYFEEALKLRRDIRTTTGTATLMKYTGLIYLEQGDIKKGRNYLLGALSIARKSRQRHIEKEVLGKITEIYLEQQDVEKTKKYFKQFIAVSDSVTNFEISNKITAYLVNDEIDKQQKEKQQLTQEKRIVELEIAQQKNVQRILILLSLSSLFIIFGIIILYRQKSRDNKRLIVKNTEIFTAHQQLKHEIEERINVEKERETLIGELKESLSRIKTLSGLIPICANCKKIRNDDGYYEQVEKYIMDHSDAVFSHGICPDCMKILYSDLIRDKES
ncbi:MAG: tetratricopeptide repeat protein, partial [Candidatus Marinimicrobia bacterium]|nr:tetratricopeptide repeat protein [Candidatus Neomarinimicrobiota bacterium]